MIKGGFQGLDISGVDLTAQSPTLPGAYAACAAADGKPIRVLTADGAVQCSVKKVSTNYVLAGVTGDGKILSITVGATDGISVSEMRPAGEEPALALDTAVDISSATSTDYVTENDGIAIITNGAATIVQRATILIRVGENVAPLVSLAPDTPVGEQEACFVKKGTALRVSNISSGVWAEFFPYKPVQS